MASFPKYFRHFMESMKKMAVRYTCHQTAQERGSAFDGNVVVSMPESHWGDFRIRQSSVSLVLGWMVSVRCILIDTWECGGLQVLNESKQFLESRQFFFVFH